MYVCLSVFLSVCQSVNQAVIEIIRVATVPSVGKHNYCHKVCVDATICILEFGKVTLDVVLSEPNFIC